MKSNLSSVVFLTFLTTGMLSCVVSATSGDDQCTTLQKACAALPEEPGRKACYDESEVVCKAVACQAQILMKCKTLDNSECFKKTTCTDDKCKEQIAAQPKGTCDAYAASWSLQVPLILLIVCSSISTFL